MDHHPSLPGKENGHIVTRGVYWQESDDRYIVTSGSSSSVFSQTTENRTRSMLTQRSLSLNENLCSVFILCAAAVVVHTWS